MGKLKLGKSHKNYILPVVVLVAVVVEAAKVVASVVLVDIEIVFVFPPLGVDAPF